MESNLCLHLGFCAQSSENCIKETTAGVEALFRDASTRAELGTKIKANLCRRWKSCDSPLEESELTTSDTGTVVDCLSIKSCGQRDAHFKGSELQASYLFQRTDSYRYSVGLAPLIWRNTRAKCCWVLKPQAMATSRTRISAERSISFALWTRYHCRHWCGV